MRRRLLATRAQTDNWVSTASNCSAATSHPTTLFFYLIVIRMRLGRSWRKYVLSFPCPQSVRGGSSQASLCPPSGLSPEGGCAQKKSQRKRVSANERTKETWARPLAHSRGCHGGGRGKDKRPPPTPSSSASALLSTSRSVRSLLSHFSTSLPVSSLARTSLPGTPVAERRSNTAWLHLPSARR